MAIGQTPKEDSVKAAIIKLSAEWNNALVKRDSAALERLLSPDYTLASAGGTLVTRKEWMNNLQGLFTDSASFIGPQKVTVFANEAICESVMHWKVSNYTKDGTLMVRNTEYLIADIWRLNNGRWQVVHRMSKVLRKR